MSVALMTTHTDSHYWTPDFSVEKEIQLSRKTKHKERKIVTVIPIDTLFRNGFSSTFPFLLLLF